ncbi:hypothetical protein PAPHI01_0569 [Pancytospora philotis]|nr:hypothetical protein PAPHI01_0569 [Pancytospora philotis]
MRLCYLSTPAVFIAAATHSLTQADSVIADKYNTLHGEIGRELHDAFETVSEVDRGIIRTCRSVVTSILDPYKAVLEEGVNTTTHKKLISKMGNDYEALKARSSEYQRNLEITFWFFDGLFGQIKKLQDLLIDYIARNEVAIYKFHRVFNSAPIPCAREGAPNRYLNIFNNCVRKSFRDLQHALEACKNNNASSLAFERGLTVIVANDVLYRAHEVARYLLFIAFDMHDVLKRNNSMFSRLPDLLTRLTELVSNRQNVKLAEVLASEIKQLYWALRRDIGSRYKVYSMNVSCNLRFCKAELDNF